MDSRIEELAEIILERAKGSADLITDRNFSDRYRTYRRCEWLAVEMLTAIYEYRVGHPDEYPSSTRTRKGQSNELDARNDG